MERTQQKYNNKKVMAKKYFLEKHFSGFDTYHMHYELMQYQYIGAKKFAQPVKQKQRRDVFSASSNFLLLLLLLFHFVLGAAVSTSGYQRSSAGRDPDEERREKKKKVRM